MGQKYIWLNVKIYRVILIAVKLVFYRGHEKCYLFEMPDLFTLVRRDVCRTCGLWVKD